MIRDVPLKHTASPFRKSPRLHRATQDSHARAMEAPWHAQRARLGDRRNDRPDVCCGPSTGGGPVQNGVTRKIGPGDVVVIPPNTPHWFTEITSDQIVYLVVRVDPHKVLPAGYSAK